MCGIVGFIGEDTDRIRLLTDCLRHRGPDGNATYVGNGISLGHARLAILDPRPEGNQPMWNEKKTVVIIYNGEIYNYRRLKEAEGLECKTTTDTEVLLKLYENHGIDFVRTLHGMFAFALYDTVKKTLFLVRDTGGIKPLYLTYIDAKPHFASEMRTLMRALPVQPDIDAASLSAFLTLQYVPGPATLCKGIESLAPGTILEWTDGREKRRTFTANTQTPVITSKRAAMAELPVLMQQIVEDHMIADKPIGLFLSGGMDSSVLLHHMAKASSKPVKTFTVRFDATEAEDAARFNRDADLALLTAKHYGTDHEELLLTAEDFRSYYEATAKSLDLPNADSVSVAQYLLAKKAKKKVDVVLSGAGGDELFGGYPRYRIFRILQALQWIPSPLRGIAGAVTGYPADVLRMEPGPALALRLLGRPNAENSLITKPEWWQEGAAVEIMKRHFTNATGDATRKMMEVDRALWLVDESLKLADAVTMASGLECRVPFVDARLTAWSNATPTRWHVELGRTKALLKDAYRSLLPAHLYTLKKASFYPPLAKWIRRETWPLLEEALNGPYIKKYCNVPALKKIGDDHKNKIRYGLHPLSSVMQFHFWCKTVYDAAV